MVAKQALGKNYQKQLVYIVWLAGYINTCLQTLSHVWFPSKYGMKQAYHNAGMVWLYKNRYSNRTYTCTDRGYKGGLNCGSFVELILSIKYHVHEFYQVL